MKILFYGNCQPDALHKMIDWKKSKHQGEYISCYLTELPEAEFQAKVKEADLIICQPVKANYRERPWLGTKSIIETNPKAHVCMFPCIWWNYYFSLEEGIEETDFMKLVGIQDMITKEYPGVDFWSLHNFIWDNFKERRLFYTSNHMTHIFYHHMVAYLMGTVDKLTGKTGGLVLDHSADPQADIIHRLVRPLRFKKGYEGKIVPNHPPVS